MTERTFNPKDLITEEAEHQGANNRGFFNRMALDPRGRIVLVMRLNGYLTDGSC